MIQEPDISIITPVWNGLPFIKDCIESVIAQEFKNWEMLIGDNCSTDGTIEYLEGLNDPRIKIFKHEKNLGIFGNLNFLFSKTTSKTSYILCADDYFIEKTSLFKIISYWQNAPQEVGIVIFNQKGNGHCSLTILQEEVLPEIIPASESDLIFYCFGNIAGNLSNVSVLNAVVAKNGGFREDLPYSGDFEFWSRAAHETSIAIQEESVTHVRRHPGVASNYLNRKGEIIWQNTFVVNRLYNELIQRFPKSLFAIRLHGTLNYDSLQRDVALKLFLKGKKEYLNTLDKVMSNALFSMSFFMRWLLFMLTAGGRLGRRTIAKYMLRKSNYAHSTV